MPRRKSTPPPAPQFEVFYEINIVEGLGAGLPNGDFMGALKQLLAAYPAVESVKAQKMLRQVQ